MQQVLRELLPHRPQVETYDPGFSGNPSPGCVTVVTTRAGRRKETAPTTQVGFCVDPGFVDTPSKLDQSVQKSIVRNVCSALRTLLDCFENKAQNSTRYDNSMLIMESSEGILSVLTDLSNSYSVISELLAQTISQPMKNVLDTCIEMKHRHDDLIQPKETPDDHSEECTCSVVQLFFRYNDDFKNEKIANKVQQFFVSLFASLSFKMYLSTEFMRYYRFMMQKEGEKKFYGTSLESIKFQIITSEVLSNHALNNFDFNHFFDMVNALFELPEPPFDFFDQIDSTLSELFKNNPEGRKKFFSNKQLTTRFLEMYKVLEERRIEFTSALLQIRPEGSFYDEISNSTRDTICSCSFYILRQNFLFASYIRKTRHYMETDMVNLMKPIVDILKKPIGSMTEKSVHQTVFFDITLERKFIMMLVLYLNLDLNT